MTDELPFEGDEPEEEVFDVSSGKFADPPEVVGLFVPADILEKFECYSYRNAAGLLANRFPDEAEEVWSALRAFDITEAMIRTPGGNKSTIAKHVDGIMPPDWTETRLSGDLTINLWHAKKKDELLRSYVRKGYLDGHRIDFVKGQIAFDLEWNSKDQTFDRDLYAFSSFYAAGAISIGLMLTRGNELDTDYFRRLGKVLTKKGTEGSEPVYKKFGASTTWMGKLLYRLDADRNGGCPVLAFGITKQCIRPE
ncbi:restriction endonuclease BglII [Hasllibacter halocynthiae]|uniref:Restriction endonuclease BglII n=1 Tax=Hasllibacter halocynthiae TaxID=595589 RepID=A0A2T0X0U4_9RHOB|nr:BglII/BstYI family type II restriction endonuclease [Hasllibacter halocynthiae]PRY92569.1 restriction endonuclease BglII [Hasllibacter halocynthiae]